MGRVPAPQSPIPFKKWDERPSSTENMPFPIKFLSNKLRQTACFQSIILNTKKIKEKSVPKSNIFKIVGLIFSNF